MSHARTVAYVLLRNSHFGPKGAASVELCVRDLARFSRHDTLVVCPSIGEPFADVKTVFVPDVAAGGNLAKAWAVGHLLKARGTDVAVVENHLPAAAVIAVASGIRTILHSHAYERAPKSALKRLERRFELGRLAGAAFCSADCAARFHEHFPDARLPLRAVPNGLDMTQWSAAGPKEPTILIVGRAIEDKGHIEAMRALAAVLPGRPDWRARFILSHIAQEPETVARLRALAADLGGRVTIDANLPYAEVRAAWAMAAIGLVLTKTPEPFGRTALEALASGAALVSSGLGGLAEVHGHDALVVCPTEEAQVAAALAALIDNPERRAGLAHRGRARVEKLYDIRVVAETMDTFVDSLGRAGS